MSKMSGKRVLIVSPNGLFREVLKQILADAADLSLTRQTTSAQEAEELAAAQQVDVVIIEQEDDEEKRKSCPGFIARLLAVPGVRVICVGMRSGDMWVYKQERVEEVSVEDLLAALDD
jgi:chemotaxis response regulator CheB